MLFRSDEKTDFPCPTCGTLMVVKNGRFGKFLACPNYPKCRTTLPYDEETGKPATQTETTNEESNVKCEKCGRTMVLKQGKYGPFLACPGYPECKNIVNIDKNGKAQEKVESAPCPQCGKPLKQINSRGSVFYGCTGYPECRFTANAPLAEGKCPDCGSHLLIRKYKDGVYHVCASKTCKYKTKAD